MSATSSLNDLTVVMNDLTATPATSTQGLAVMYPDTAHIVGESHAYPAVIPDADNAARERGGTEVTSSLQSFAIILSIAMVTGVSSMLNGLVTVILPTLIKELRVDASLQIWPISITALTCGCTLLLAGSICDVVGSKFMYLLGTILQTAFVLGSGLSTNGFEIILFRGLTGVAVSFCLPSAVSIITSSFHGKKRNMAFAVLGSGQPVGFSIGLVLGGLLTQYVTWRVGFYIGAGIIGANIGLILWALPGSPVKMSWTKKRRQILEEIDWVGAALASTSLAMSSYVFATITGSTGNIKQVSTVALLVASTMLVPIFVLWMDRQETAGRPALIPNSLWRNKYFSTITLAVFLSWGVFNGVETMLTFYFQEAQLLSPLQTSLRFLPAAIAGFAMEILAGALVHRVSANLVVNVGFCVVCAAPLIMAFASPTSSYWTTGFLANCLNPIGVDVLFTTANLVITSVFPPKTQALAGGVFNTVSQIGKSVGVALTAVVASSVTANSAFVDKTSPDALMKGYQAAFLYSFGLSVATLILSLVGLRKIGKVGHKRD